MLIIAFILLIIYFIYEPSIDITKEGDILLWYNKNNNRQYKILWKK
jgi:hypothetical protein